MRGRSHVFILTGACAVWMVGWACADRSPSERAGSVVGEAASEVVQGFMLKAGAGERVLNGIVIKVSPETGSEGSILLEQTFPRGGATNLHAHDQGDEVIYVVSGRGQARIGDDVQVIGPGDVVFVPRGHAHQVSNREFDEPLRAVAFMDSPELAEELRALHARMESAAEGPITDEERAAIVERIGGSRAVPE